MAEYVGLAGWALAGGGYVGVAFELGPDGKALPKGRRVECGHHFHHTEHAARACGKRLAEQLTQRESAVKAGSSNQ